MLIAIIGLLLLFILTNATGHGANAPKVRLQPLSLLVQATKLAPSCLAFEALGEDYSLFAHQRTRRVS